MFHTCPESETLLRTIEWDRGKWKCGVQIVTKCPCCKEKLPHAKDLNKVDTCTLYWGAVKFPGAIAAYEYEAPVLSIKPPRAYTRKSK